MTETTPKDPKRYSLIKTRLFVFDLVFTLVFLAGFQIFLSRPVSDLGADISSNFYISCAVFVFIFMLFMYVTGFPIHFISGYVVEHKYGLSRQSLKAWGKDEVKSAVLSLILSMFCIMCFYLILRVFPGWWWIIAALGWIFFTVILTRFMPVLLIPLFYKYRPIEDMDLKQGIMDLAEKTGIRLMDVCEIDFSKKTTKANAALVGLGKTRKVILADTLINNFTYEEVMAVVAHEFGHFKYRHIWQLLFFSGGVTIGGFFVLYLMAGKIVEGTNVAAISDPYILPILMLLMILSGLLILPVQNLFSRILERQADRFSLRKTADEAFISVMTKLAERNMADTEPSVFKKIFLYSHPPISERIRMAKNKRY